MKLRLPLLLLLLGLLGSVESAWAQVYRPDLPPEERRQMRQQMREHWQQERDVRRDDGGRRWQEVPPEDFDTKTGDFELTRALDVLKYNGDVKLAAANPRGAKLADSDLVDKPGAKFDAKAKAATPAGAVSGTTSGGSSSSASASSSSSSSASSSSAEKK